MKISFLIPSLEVGGSERQTVVLANGLSKAGHDVSVVLFRHKGQLIADLDKSVRLYDLDKGGQGDIIGFLIRSGRFFRRERPDILYTFLGIPNLTGAILQFFLPTTKLVWAVRASDMDMTQYGALSRWSYGLECKLSNIPDLIIANSDSGRRHAVANGYPERLITVIPNGIDTDHFQPDLHARNKVRTEWRIQADTPLFGMAARFDPMKDHPNFFRAAALIAEQIPGAMFACIGTGPKDYVDKMKQVATAENVMDRIIWAGRREDMAQVYNALDVMCLSSAYGEGFPNVLGEAMACDIPCVATDVGDCATIIGTTGAIVSKSDHHCFAQAMNDVFKEKGKGSPRARILETFSIDRMLNSTSDSLSQLL